MSTAHLVPSIVPNSSGYSSSLRQWMHCVDLAIDNTLHRVRNSAFSVDPTSKHVKHLRFMRLVRVDIPMVMSGRSAGPETQYQSWSESTLLRDRITCKSYTNQQWSSEDAT